MTHPTRGRHRVSPTGQHMGRNAARMAALGQIRLKAMGLENHSVPAVRSEMCPTCACREGTVPNGCLQTQLDLLKSATEGKGFYCHSPRDGRMCAGWASVRAELVANPLPPGAMVLLARWQYSPTDEDGANDGFSRSEPKASESAGNHS